MTAGARGLSRRSPLVSFLVSRVEPAGVIGVAIILVAVVLLATARVRTPFHPLSPVVGGLEVISLAAGIPISMMVLPASKTLEAGIRRVTILRYIWSTTLILGTMLLVGVGALAGGAVDPLVAVRNSVVSAGLVLVSATLVGARLAWMPSLGLTLAVFRYGMELEGVRYAWALPLAPGTEPVPWLLGVAVAVAGIVSYGRWDVREWET